MIIDPPRAVAEPLSATDFAWTARDVILYHLAVGARESQADFSYTWERDLKVLPTFAVVPPLASVEPVLRGRLPGLGYEIADVLHGEHELTLRGPLPSSGRCQNRARIVGIHDKGHAALVDVQIDSHVDGAPEPLFENRFRLFVRGAGGFGGPPERRRAPVRTPNRPPDAVVSTPTASTQALLYRLCGDLNPLHVDPLLAQRAGFEGPILHGLCTYGIACKVAVDTLLSGEVERLGSFRSRFAGVVYPGETLVTELWSEPGHIILRASTAERESPVLSHAQIDLTPAGTRHAPNPFEQVSEVAAKE